MYMYVPTLLYTSMIVYYTKTKERLELLVLQIAGSFPAAPSCRASRGRVSDSAVRADHTKRSLAHVQRFVHNICGQKTRCSRLPLAVQLAHALDVRKPLLKCQQKA